MTNDRNKAFVKNATIYFVIHQTFHCPPFDLRSFGTCLYQNFWLTAHVQLTLGTQTSQALEIFSVIFTLGTLLLLHSF